MINLAAALKRRRLEEQSGSISRSNVNTAEQMQCFFSGGNDLLFNILVRLPVELLIKLKLVCKYWMYLFKHDKRFIDLHFTWSKTRLLDEHTFIIYPTRQVNELMPIKRFSFNRKGLTFEGSLDHESSYTAAAVVTSNNVNLNEKPMLMLEPVNGLVCFVKGGGGAIEHSSLLIYNPSTREKTEWIDTVTSAAFRKLFGLKLRGCRGKSVQSSYKYMFGFGIDPATNQHKVLCIIEIIVRESILRRELVCGVFTVGKNTWRKIGQVPHNTAIKRNSVHVCGSIYWMPSKMLRSQYGVMVFDFESETFRSIKIPNSILDLWSSMVVDPWSLNGKKKLVHELAEVDGHLAILVREGDNILNIWIYIVDEVSSATDGWIKETMQLPFRWDKIHKLTFKAITGTSLVVIKILRGYRHGDQYRSEFLHYYDRREKKFYEKSFEILLEPTGTSGVVQQWT
ncbi:hypothetical protein MKW92_021061 [Papaver armeniacum]|nr:hypothetical protein MKW92_021061 [Papaver armeniacum]